MMRSLIALVFGGFLLFALPALAQTSDTGSGALTITANPAYPGPNSTVVFTAESPLLDLQDSSITWTVNGTPAGSGVSTKVTMGPLGKETDIGVSVSGASGSDSTSIAIVPTSIDLLWEADSYIPPFYKGRAVPGSGSSIRALAIPHFIDGSGNGVPSSNIDFTWSVNGAVDRSQSGLGESSATFPAAILYGNDVVTVVARTVDGSLSGEASATVETQAPQLALYEDSPLFGVLYYKPVSQTSLASESETTFAAVPYFANARSANDPSLSYQWAVNGSNVASDSQDPSEITISAQSSDTADVTLSISDPSDPFFSASGEWHIGFTGPTTNSNDQFHTAQ